MSRPVRINEYSGKKEFQCSSCLKWFDADIFSVPLKKYFWANVCSACNEASNVYGIGVRDIRYLTEGEVSP